MDHKKELLRGLGGKACRTSRAEWDPDPLQDPTTAFFLDFTLKLVGCLPFGFSFCFFWIREVVSGGPELFNLLPARFFGRRATHEDPKP